MKYRVRNNFSQDPNECLKDVLIQRGVEDVEHYLNPTKECELNPYDLDNIEKGAYLLLRHLNNNSKILIIVDADADGYTSASILWLYCKRLFPHCNLSFTIHTEKQHGLDDKIDWLEEEHFDLVICPDAASFDIKEHYRLDGQDTDVLVIDHHEPKMDEQGNQILSNAKNTIVINNQLSKKYGNKTLCGAGVVYKFCKVLDDIMNVSYAVDYIDLVALGEISDVMNQGTNETRYYIKTGLKKIHNEGFRALIEVQSFSLKEKAVPPYLGITPIDIAFYVTPLINALVRVGTQREKEVLFYAFTEPNKIVPSTKRGAKIGDTETAASQTARVAGNAKNRQNKQKEKAIELIDDRILKNGLLENNIIIVEITEKDNIPSTLTGLIAAHFVNKYRRPCLLVRENNEGFLRGSMRSSQNFETIPDFKAFLEASGAMDYVAGHPSAAGVSIHTTNLNNLLKYSNNELDGEDFQEDCYLVDYVLKAYEDFEDLGLAFAKNPDCFGNGIDEVKVIIKDIPIEKYLIMGNDKTSIKLSHNRIDYVRFKDQDFIDQIVSADPSSTLEIYGRFNLNTWAGRESLQIFIDDYNIIETDKFSF